MNQTHQPDRHAVIMAGGVGSRFWPMSRLAKPKQFLDILGTGETLIQATFRRLLPMFRTENIWVVTNQDYLELVKLQLPEIPHTNILLEPDRKNTAPCLALAAYKIQQRHPEALLFVAASDHLITKEAQFLESLEKGLNFAAANDVLLTLGIKPNRPDTGYGYIQADMKKSSDTIYKVKTFTEKPDESLAKEFLKSGDFFWNSGNFIWKASSFLQSFEQHLPEDAQLFHNLIPYFGSAEEKPKLAQTYSMLRNISVDYAVMEKADNVYMLAADLGWSDLGTWGSLYEEITATGAANALLGSHIVAHESTGCLVYSTEQKLVVLQGVKDLIVAQSGNMLLVCNRKDEQKIKAIVNEISLSKGEDFI
jgi:mannose-1-phosphate guanylyltransferase